MKNVLLLLNLIMLSSTLFSQTEYQSHVANKLSFQAGINATDFIKQFIVLNNNNLNLPLSPYLINFKVFQNVFFKREDLKLGLRAGTGYNFKESSATNNNSSSDFITRIEKFDFRIGIELQQAISKRLVVFYGADYFVHDEKNHTESRILNTPSPPQNSDPTITEDKLTYKGISGVMGLQFNFNKHLNINTEMLLGYRTGQGNTTLSGPNFPKGRRDANGIREFFLIPPSFINLNFMF
ncbi:MAG: hypothetical protein H7296_14890 [Bacteroidia bacterium]|nr:hypothetical protein [Bacteroidia bacterium]